MSETREHRRRVLRLVRSMHRRGITVLAADAPGWPVPPMVGNRRPDVVGFYSVAGVAVAGEVKRGPELWSCFAQFFDVASALSGLGPKGGCALLIIAAADEWMGDAADVCDALRCPGTWVAAWPEAA